MPREFAPGIPARDVFKPVREVGKEGPNEVWALSLSRHDARRAGKHYDLRLTDPETGDAHSWALPKANWPDPGQKVLAVPQPTHTAEYAARKGKWEIAGGYGAGTVKSKMLEPVEVVESSPRKITFNLFGPGQQVGQYSIIRTGNGSDLLVNHSPVGRQVGGSGGYAIPSTKPKYRETSFDNLDVSTDDVMQAKIDGAHVVVGLQAGKPARVFSYRESVKQPVIEHTHRIPDWNQREVPSGLGGTVLRAELWGERGGKAIPASELGGLLNTDVWKSRLQQEAKGIKLQLSPFDVEKYQGRDAGNMNWEQKRDILQRAAESLNWLRLPPTATTPGEKKKLIKAIESGKLPETSEGVVLFPKEGPPIKAKITPEYDGAIVGTFEGKGRLEGKGIGGFLIKDESTGVVNRVGGGLSDKLRRAAYEEPGFFKGLIAKIRSRGKFPGGKMRDPRFAGFHLDKNDPEYLVEVDKYATGSSFDEERRGLITDERVLAAFLDELQKIGAIWTTSKGVFVDPGTTGEAMVRQLGITGSQYPTKLFTQRRRSMGGGLVTGAKAEPGFQLYTQGRAELVRRQADMFTPDWKPSNPWTPQPLEVPRGHSVSLVGGRGAAVGKPVPTGITGLERLEAPSLQKGVRRGTIHPATVSAAGTAPAAATRSIRAPAATIARGTPTRVIRGAAPGKLRSLIKAVGKVAGW